MMNEIAPDDKELVKDRMRRVLETPDISKIVTDIAHLNTLHSSDSSRPGLEAGISRDISRVVEVLLK